MITSEQKGILTRYADIKLEMKKLEEEQDMLNPQVMSIMVDNDQEEITLTDYGKFSRSSRRKWTYTLDTQEKEAALKDRKKNEEQLGLATYEENFFVKFTGEK